MALLTINIGPTELTFDEVVAGSEMRFSFKLEYETSTPGTFLPFDFTGYTLTGNVKKNVNDSVITSFALTTPGVEGAGWVDCVLDGTKTTTLGALGKCQFMFSIKMTPIGDANAGVTLVVGEFPVIKRATP